MPIKDSYPAIYAKAVKTDTATTDAYELNIPYTGVGYTVRRVTAYNSRTLTTGATVNGATASLGVFGAAAGAGASVVADAALTGLTGSTIVLDRTVAATGISPILTGDTLYIRVGTASGAANSGIDVCVEYQCLA